MFEFHRSTGLLIYVTYVLLYRHFVQYNNVLLSGRLIALNNTIIKLV
jgi:hypothetical protein